MKTVAKVLVAIAAVGILLIIVGGVLIPVLGQQVHDKIVQQVPLQNGTESYKTWQNPPADMYLQFYVFDVVNAKDIRKNGSKPIVRQRGPYTYREIRSKRNMSFSANGTRLTYNEPKTYVFVREMSAGNENDTFTTINFPALTAADWVRNETHFFQVALRYVLRILGEDLFKEFEVGQYLYGYEEPTLKLINEVYRDLTNRTLFQDDKMGLFHGPNGNGSDDGTYTIGTGRKDINLLNEIQSWNGNKSLSYWGTRYCNMVNGTDGSGWHPYVKTTDTIYIFSSDICRSLPLEYDRSHVLKGISVMRFSPAKLALANHTENPDNIGFCTFKCLGAGVLDTSVCRSGVPLIMSLPHFYMGNPSYREAIIGLHPDEKQHRTFVDVEYYTGATLHAGKKLQLNFYIRNLTSLTATQKLPPGTIFPVLWLNESALITDSGANKLKNEVLWPIYLVSLITYLLIGLGILLLVIVLIVSITLYYRNRGKPVQTLLVNPVSGPQADDKQPLLNGGGASSSYGATGDGPEGGANSEGGPSGRGPVHDGHARGGASSGDDAQLGGANSESDLIGHGAVGGNGPPSGSRHNGPGDSASGNGPSSDRQDNKEEADPSNAGHNRPVGLDEDAEAEKKPDEEAEEDEDEDEDRSTKTDNDTAEHDGAPYVTPGEEHTINA